MTVARVDCLVEIITEDSSGFIVLAIARRGDRIVGAWYDAPANGDEGPYTKENTVSLGASDDELKSLGHLYSTVEYDYEPARLARQDVGYGKPKLKRLLHKQCDLQPKLRCGKPSGG